MCLYGVLARQKFGRRSDCAVVDKRSSVLIALPPALCGYFIALPFERKARINVAPIEHYARVPKDEIYGAVYVTLSEYLCVGVCVECILVPLETASIKG